MCDKNDQQLAAEYLDASKTVGSHDETVCRRTFLKSFMQFSLIEHFYANMDSAGSLYVLFFASPSKHREGVATRTDVVVNLYHRAMAHRQGWDGFLAAAPITFAAVFHRIA